MSSIINLPPSGSGSSCDPGVPSAALGSGSLVWCVTYTRVSTDEQARKEHNSCDTQEGYCDELIERHRSDGWVKKHSISDPGYSGSNLNRPGIRQLVDLVKTRQIAVIVVYRRDRLFRDTGDSSELQAFFDYHNVIVASVVEGIHDQAPHSRFARTMIDAMSEFERLTILGRVRDAVRAKAQRGEWKGGTAPYGYSYTPGTNVPFINEEEARNVRFIFEAIADGMGTAELCRLLREKGIYTRDGRRKGRDGVQVFHQIHFDADQIRRMIRQPIYRGYLRVRNPEAPENVDPHTPEAWQLFKGLHQAIVSEEVWLRANRNLGKPNSVKTAIKTRPIGNPLSFLAGITRCAECRSAMTPASARKRRKDGGQHRYLRCSKHLKSADQSTCSTRSLAAAAAETAVLSLINEIADSRSPLARLEKKDRLGRVAEQIGKLKAELIALDEKIASAKSKIETAVGHVTRGEYQALTPELVQMIEKEKSNLRVFDESRIHVESALLKAGAKMPAPEQLAIAFRKIAVSMAGVDVKTQASIARQVFDHITVRRIVPTEANSRHLRMYRLTVRIATTRVMNFGVNDIAKLTGFHRFSDLEFSITIEVHSNKTEQAVFIVETNYTTVSTSYQRPPSPKELEAGTGNPIQKAIKWKSMLDAGVSSLARLAELQKVSKGLISQHVALLKLPPKIVSFLAEGRDFSLERPFSLRELQRLACLPHSMAEEQFLARVMGVPFQDQLGLDTGGTKTQDE